MIEVMWDFAQVKEGVEEIAIMLRLCLILLNLFRSDKKGEISLILIVSIYLKKWVGMYYILDSMLIFTSRRNKKVKSVYSKCGIVCPVNCSFLEIQIKHVIKSIQSSSV